MFISIFCSISFLQMFPYFIYTLVNVFYMVFAGGKQVCTLSELRKCRQKCCVIIIR